MRLPAVIKDRDIQRNFDFISKNLAREVSGTVSAAGAIVVGTGFTVSKIGTGQYTVTFTTKFSSSPTIVVSSGTTVANYVTKLTARSETAFSVNTFDISPLANQDREFDFVARL